VRTICEPEAPKNPLRGRVKHPSACNTPRNGDTKEEASTMREREDVRQKKTKEAADKSAFNQTFGPKKKKGPAPLLAQTDLPGQAERARNNVDRKPALPPRRRDSTPGSASLKRKGEERGKKKPPWLQIGQRVLLHIAQNKTLGAHDKKRNRSLPFSQRNWQMVKPVEARANPKKRPPINPYSKAKECDE